jgi:hypothetical protein
MKKGQGMQSGSTSVLPDTADDEVAGRGDDNQGILRRGL